MRVVVCAMAKNEHLYINEWVSHYVKLGFDTIYLYDNDNLDSPYIGDYIDKKYLDKVEIINIRGIHRERLQHDTYTEFYNTHAFDWCLFCDIDEYLYGVRDIKMFLKKFTGVNQIRIKWRLFGDDDMVSRDIRKPIQTSFTRVVYHTLSKDLRRKGNLEREGKAIVRGGLKNVVVRSPHFASYGERNNVIPSVLPSGMPCRSKVVINEDYSKEIVYINHYMTKTLEEFVKQKLGRNDAVFDTPLDLSYFWRVNRMTKEKLKWLQDHNLMP